MRLLTALIMLLLCLSSCQQRYWHVKRFKVDKTPTVGIREKEKLQADSTVLLSYYDSGVCASSGLTEKPEELCEDNTSFIPRDNGSKYENNTFPAPRPKLKTFIEKAHPKFFRDKNSAFDPLTTEEILLILAIYLIVFMAIGVLVGLFAYFIFFWLFIQLLFGSITYLLLLLLLILVLVVIQLILTYFIARTMIRKKLQKDLTDFELLSYFFVFLAVLAAVGYISNLTGSIIGSGFLLIALILAIIYVILY
ncbi:MAG TPA: hypothetical protein DIW47_10695 [Bacteroidetes bacterium]|nr:hypothetical protein [Bacteroidota bacterium]